MKNTLGVHLSVTLFGESHGKAVGAVIDGLTPGVPVDEGEIARQLARRRPSGAGETARVEPDHFEIVSGVFQGRATGTPLCILIPNTDTRSGDYAYGPARPSHADYAAFCKYHGYEDYRGGGHFSGRITAALVAAGGILLPALMRLGVRVATHILRCAGEEDAPLAGEEDALALAGRDFPVIDEEAGARMRRGIEKARAALDSVGGVTQTGVFSLPAGLGEPWFDSVEGRLSRALFGVGGIKGVEFGLGFGFSGVRGSEANDPLRAKDGRVVSLSNHNGGVNGGITNGMPVIFQCAVKPTPSIARAQQTVNFLTGENTQIAVTGRHDPAIIRRVCPVIDSVTAIVLGDMLIGRYGEDVLVKGF